MNRMKFEGRMNYFMLTAIRSAKNEDGLISDRDLKAIETDEGTYWLCGGIEL